MNDTPSWIKFVKNLPAWLKGAIAAITTIVGFIIAFRDNYRLYIVITSIAVIIALFYFLWYIAYSRYPSHFGGIGILRFERYRKLSFLGIATLLISIIVMIFNTTVQDFIDKAIFPDELVTVDLSNDLILEYQPFPSSEYPNLIFAVTNSGKENILIDAIWLEVTSVNHPYSRTEFPEDLYDPLDPYPYQVTIKPRKGSYLITDDDFIYKPSDTDSFNITVWSTEYDYMYEAAIKVDWYSLDRPEAKQQSTVGTYFLGFPKGFDLGKLLQDSSKVDYFLNYESSIDRLILGNFSSYTESVPKRLLLSGGRISGGELENLSIRLASTAPEINLSPYYRRGSQYMILYGIEGSNSQGSLRITKKDDAAVVIQDICCSEGEIIWESQKVEQYIQHFEKLWNKAGD